MVKLSVAMPRRTADRRADKSNGPTEIPPVSTCGSGSETTINDLQRKGDKGEEDITWI